MSNLDQKSRFIRQKFDEMKLRAKNEQQRREVASFILCEHLSTQTDNISMSIVSKYFTSITFFLGQFEY